MLYAIHEAAYRYAAPLNLAARLTRDFWRAANDFAGGSLCGRSVLATADLTANLTRRYVKPDWNIDSVVVNGLAVPIRERTVWRTPWVALRHLSRDPDGLAAARAGKTGRRAPPVLIVAPLSGHHATLLRGTVQTFLADHDVYVTDWLNARDVPVIAGRFDFHDYIDTVRRILETLGERAHVVAVCQPGPPVLAAAALMAEEGHPSRPASLTFMGSPIDARLSPTVTNRLAEARPFAWFQSHMIYSVPPPYIGVWRRVYPGFVQLYSFMSMNAEKHQDAHKRYFDNLVRGDGESADRHRQFYNEYLSVLDLTEEFYLQTVDVVFQRHLLPKGELIHRGRAVDPGALRDIGLMTVEGERDDISGVGQTQAAHALCGNIPDELRELYVQPGVGHYGVFNGRRFDEEIYPRIRDFIARAEGALRDANPSLGASHAPHDQAAAAPNEACERRAA
ncbi:MAG: polyhydroxyalkanoate depolymerase [Caulobacteraceae bacterium]